MRIFCASLIALSLLAGHAKAEEKEVYQTKMDFDSTMLDGKMKAPTGFFLQGRNKQSLTNLVKLRSNFKPQLKDSKAAVQSLVK